MAIEYIEIDEQATILIEVVAPSASTVIEVSGGAKGERGESGSIGSLPPGGTVGQTLIKQSSTDADAEWTTLTKASVGLALVNNTSDENKPVSALQQEALDEKANAVHSHAISNVTGLQGALDAKVDPEDLATVAVSGSYNDLEDKPSLLAIGTTSDTAKRGDYTPSIADLPAGTTMTAVFDTTWPARPTNRTDIVVLWLGGTEAPSNALTNDLWIRNS